jgi:hypothetical protein
LDFSAKKLTEPVFSKLNSGSVTDWVGGWTGAKTDWAGFQQTEHKFVAGWVERWTRAKTSWAGPKTGWAGFQKLVELVYKNWLSWFSKTESKLGEGWVENLTSFTKNIHDQNSRLSLEDFEEK